MEFCTSLVFLASKWTVTQMLILLGISNAWHYLALLFLLLTSLMLSRAFFKRTLIADHFEICFLPVVFQNEICQVSSGFPVFEYISDHFFLHTEVHAYRQSAESSVYFFIGHLCQIGQAWHISNVTLASLYRVALVYCICIIENLGAQTDCVDMILFSQPRFTSVFTLLGRYQWFFLNISLIHQLSAKVLNII